MDDILFYTCTIAEGKIWFVSIYGDFMNMDIKTKKMSFVLPKNMGGAFMKAVTDKMLVNGDAIYWLEYDAQHLVRYSVAGNTCKFYEMPVIDCKGEECFAGIAMYNQKIYMFPRYTPYLVIFDTVNEKFIVQDDLYQTLNTELFQRETEFLFRSYQLGDALFFLRRKNKNAYRNTIIKYSLDSRNYETFVLSEEIENPVNICRGEDYLYILCADTSLYRIDECHNKTERIYASENVGESFLGISLMKQSLYLLPSRSENIKIIDLDTLNVKNFDNYPIDFKYMAKCGSKYYGYNEDEKYIYYGNRSANYILKMDKELDLIEWIKPQLPTKEEAIAYYLKTRNEIVVDESRFGLQMIFGSIKRKQGREDNKICVWAGMNIWKKISEGV